MRKFFISTVLCCILQLSAFAIEYTQPLLKRDTLPGNQAGVDTSIVDEDGNIKVFEKVDIEAQFHGGDDGWRQFLIANVNANTPADKGAPAGTYTVVVQFIVDKDGSVSDIKALTRHGFGMEAEVVRMIKKSPKWSPAIQCGKPVRAYRKQPVTFVVEEAKRKRRS